MSQVLMINLLAEGLGNFSVLDLVPAVGIFFIILAMFSLLRKRKRRDANRLTPHEQIEKIQQHRGMRGDLEDLMVEIEQMAKRVGAQLDNKSIALEKLIREADERIARLEQLQQAGGGSAGQTVEAGGNKQVEVELPEDPLARKVYQLADEGNNPQQIAEETGEHIGKVELILALREHG